MIARLVEQRVMSFEDTLAESFPAFAKEMDPAYRSVTVMQLLSHTAGLPPASLTHSGSNGYWLVDVRIMPRRDMIILVAMNSGHEAAETAVVDIGKPLKDRLKPFE